MMDFVLKMMDLNANIKAGVAAAWYFDTQEENEKPLRASIRRALTSSFGSVCLGSLLVGILRTMNSIGRGMRGNGADPSGGNFAMVLLRGICVQYAGLFNHIVPYFNQYAFTQIAIYGLPYTAAAKASFNMVKVGGVAPLISNSVLVMVIGVGTIWCGAIAAALGVLIALGSPMLFDTTVVTVVGNAQTNVSETDELLLLKTMHFVSKTREFCIKNDGFRRNSMRASCLCGLWLSRASSWEWRCRSQRLRRSKRPLPVRPQPQSPPCFDS